MAAAATAPATLASAPTGLVAQALRSSGLCFDLGAVSYRVRSDNARLPEQMVRVYGHYPVCQRLPWVDIDVQLERARGLRRWIRGQVHLWCDGSKPFDPFPQGAALPLLEWGVNYVIGTRMNHLLLLHAAVVERDGCALLLPATPGSGKSTLAAALSLRGWRLMSDEFGAYDPAEGAMKAILKPIGLKNESIDVIRAFDSSACIGPSFMKTRKGTVAHLAAKSEDVSRRSLHAPPRMVLLPRWRAGAATSLTPIDSEQVFSAVAFNAFNYEVLGESGFRAAIDITRACSGWQLEYSDLEEALRVIGSAFAQASGSPLPTGAKT